MTPPIGHWAWHQFVERYIEWSGFLYSFATSGFYESTVMVAKKVTDGVLHHYVSCQTELG
jgi:hypothetical protein